MKLKNFDPLDYLQNEEDCREALIAAYEEDPGDGSLIASTLGDIAKARGMTQLARETGLSRENLYRSLSGQGRPESATILKISRALGFFQSTIHIIYKRGQHQSSIRATSGENFHTLTAQYESVRSPPCHLKSNTFFVIEQTWLLVVA